MTKNSQKLFLGIITSIMFVVPMLGIPHATAATQTGIMIPLYSYPTNVAWSNLIAAKNAHPSVPIVAIINPNSGPGTSQNQAFVTGIQKLKDSGIIVLGYIPTKYAARSSSSVMADIDSYKSWYAVDGVKFDEMTNTVGYETYYSNLSTYAKSKGFTMTVGNPGADVPQSYIGIVDNLSIFENGYLPSLSYLGGWHTNYDKKNFSAESYGISTLDQSYVTAASQYLGYIYLTNDNLPNPWDTTSSYLETLAATLDVVPSSPVTSSTIVSSNVNPSGSGQSVTFTATVSGSGGTPSGTVTFFDGLNNIAIGTLSSGTVTFITSSLAVGTHSITVVYSGNSNFNTSTSPAMTQTVNKGSTTTTLSSSLNPSNSGQSVTFTATVSPVSPASGTRTGTVTFHDGATILGTGTLAGGTATLSTTTLGTGTHDITASYAGDSNFNTSTSSTLTQTVNDLAPVASSTTISSSISPSVVGQFFTFTATVSGSGGTPTGTVTFFDSATSIGTGTLAGGIATLSTTLAVGTHDITAVYSGDSNFNTSTSPAMTQTVNKGSTTTTLSSSLNPSNSGQSVTFTATVSPVSPASGTRTGTVTFHDGATILGTGTLAGGTATLSTTTLGTGTHSITASYGGDSNFNSSTSSTLAQTVNSPSLTATTTTISSNLNPIKWHQTLTFTATVSGSGGTPTGTVTFRDGAATLGTSTLTGGTATFTTTTLATGTHGITAVYSGDSNFNTSTGSILSQVIYKGGSPSFSNTKIPKH